MHRSSLAVVSVLVASCVTSPDAEDRAARAVPSGGALVARIGVPAFEGSGHVNQRGLLTFEADGRSLVQTGHDAALERWDLESGARGATFGVVGPCWGGAVSLDRASVASISIGGVTVFALPSGEVRARIASDDIGSAALSADGASLAWARTNGREVHVVDVPTGRELACHLVDTSTYALAFSPDGRTIAVAVAFGARLLDAATGRVLRELPRLGYPVSAVAWSPAGDQLAYLSYEGLLLLDLSRPDGRVLEVKLDAGVRGMALAVSGEGASPVFAVGISRDAPGPTLLLVDARTGETRHVGGDARQAPVYAAAFSPDGAVVATAGLGGIRVWRVADGADLARTCHEGAVESAAFSPDSRTLATGSADAVCLWTNDDDDRQLLARIPVLASSIAFTPDGSLACLGDSGGVVSFVDPATRTVTRTVCCTLEYDTCQALSRDARWLVVGSARPDLVRFDLATGRREWTLRPDVAEDGGALGGVLSFANAVSALAISPDGETVVAGCYSGEVVVLDARTGAERGSFDLGAVPIILAFSPDGSMIAAQASGRSIELRSAATRRRRWTLDGSPRVRLLSPAFSPDGRWLAASEPDDSISIFDVTTGERISRLDDGPTTDASARVIVFSPDGRHVVQGHSDRSARVWTLAR